MSMNKAKLKLGLVLFVVSSLFFIGGIYGIFTRTNTNINVITISQKTSYTVVHEIMNLDGTTYSEHSRTNYSDVLIGTTVSPSVLTLQGFNSPSVQTVTLDSYANTVITYRYTRQQYTLTINNSNYVTTSTPSGTYYYGQEIHLVAAADDGNGNPFVKWSDNTTNRDYTFTMTDNVTIEPIYGQPYTITYEPNNGDSAIIDYVIQNQALGTFPTVTYDDCSSGTGDYHARGCTYAYELEGWYTEPGFVNRVDESYVPTGDTTLYANWNKIYYANDGPFVCDGSNYINTGIKMFDSLNANKDFIITFTVDQNNGYTGGDRGTIFADMNESGEPFPGVHFYSTNTTNYTMNINITGHKVKDNQTGYVTGQSVVIKKVNGIVYYSYDGGTDVQINDFSNFTTFFDNNATFCAGTNKTGAAYRFFDGTLSDMSVELIDLGSYKLHFDANGGTGTMEDQVIKLGKQVSINRNMFTKNDDSFGGWNTRADGTGTSYPNNYYITSDLGNKDDVITLYAQWIPATHYNVHFDANGGIGSMTDKRFIISDLPRPLTQNAFTKANYEFRGWNTRADGTGTHYDDMEAVSDLSLIDEDTVTLYAEWWKIEYNHLGDAVFDGTASTFIDTGVNVFSQANINKDFEIRFTFKSVASDLFSVSPTQPTMFNVKDESNNKYPGFNIRFNGNINTMNATNRWGGASQTNPSSGIATSHAPIEFVYKRTNGVITMQYSYSGYTSIVHTLIDQSSWTLNQPFATNVAFGGYFDSTNTPGRFFKGTLADMIILIDD